MMATSYPIVPERVNNRFHLRGHDQENLSSIMSTIILRVSVPELYTRYQRGYYNRPLPHHAGLNPRVLDHPVVKKQLSLLPTNRFFIMTNHHYLEVTKSSTDSYVTKRCLHCARDIKGTPVGCPTKRTILRRCHKNIISTYEVFHTEGSYCHYNCIWTKLMRSHRGDADSADTCANLLWLCKILHPTETLKLLPDPHYLQCHGGTMTDDEYDRECLQHATHNAVIMTPLMRSSYIIKSK
jgi:hypothetical protein